MEKGLINSLTHCFSIFLGVKLNLPLNETVSTALRQPFHSRFCQPSWLCFLPIHLAPTILFPSSFLPSFLPPSATHTTTTDKVVGGLQQRPAKITNSSLPFPEPLKRVISVRQKYTGKFSDSSCSSHEILQSIFLLLRAEDEEQVCLRELLEGRRRRRRPHYGRKR